MSRFVSKPGTWNIAVTSPARAETPILKVANLTKGNTIRVTANFHASPDNGFYYEIKSTGNDVVSLTPASGVVQGSSDTWQCVNRVAFFLVDKVSAATGVEDVDFEVLFTNQDLSGKARLNNFSLIGEVVPTYDAEG